MQQILKIWYTFVPSSFFWKNQTNRWSIQRFRIESRSLRSTTADNNHESERNNRHRLSRATRSKQWIGEQETAGNTSGRTHQHPLRLCDRLTLSMIRCTSRQNEESKFFFETRYNNIFAHIYSSYIQRLYSEFLSK